MLLWREVGHDRHADRCGLRPGADTPLESIALLQFVIHEPLTMSSIFTERVNEMLCFIEHFQGPGETILFLKIYYFLKISREPSD